jgi:hypothetical protein
LIKFFFWSTCIVLAHKNVVDFTTSTDFKPLPVSDPFDVHNVELVPPVKVEYVPLYFDLDLVL